MTFDSWSFIQLLNQIDVTNLGLINYAKEIYFCLKESDHETCAILSKFDLLLQLHLGKEIHNMLSPLIDNHNKELRNCYKNTMP